jgi:eukaryotic-like serine/threonine-protein kinase
VIATMIGEKLLHYRITERIGEGGMGVVYRATDTRLGRDVAIKMLPDALPRDQERRARLEREARLLAQLNHSAVATLHGLEEADGRPFLVMELVAGETLAERIGGGPIPLETAGDWFRQIAEGLQVAHERGIVHRDLKPANVKITPEGRVKLLDFGLAKLFGPTLSSESSPDSAALTREREGTETGVLLGTVAYMSPEQARGQPVDKRTDIWSFGCCYFEALSGKTAFLGETVSDTIARVLECEPDWAAVDAPPKVVAVLKRCLRKEATRRIHDIADVRLELEDAFTAPPDELTPKTGKRERTLGALGAALAIALLTVGILISRSERSDTAVIRSLVAPPAGGAFFLEAEGPAPVVVSPDGTQLAFGATDVNGVRRLWVRRLDELSSRALPGTEDARYPFWSPDGRSLGFFTFQELKRVETDGGRARPLANVVNGKGGTWNEDGVIVFAPGTGPLHRMAADGGPTSAVTSLDTERHEDSHRHPRFLPDGTRFLFLTRQPAASFERYRLMLGSLQGGTPKDVTSSASQAEFQNGYLWLVRAGTLTALPFDPVRAEVRGEAVSVVEAVGYLEAAGLGLFSLSSEVVAYHSDWTPERSSLLWYDRDGESVGALGTPAVHISVELSPDGTSAAVVSTDESGNEDVWIRDLERDVATRFTFDRGNDIEPIWSPDGARIAFTKGSGEPYVQPVIGGGEAVRLETLSRSFVTGDWAPDGRHMVGFSFGDRLSDLWLLPLEGEGPPTTLQQTPFREWQPDVSPDGRWLTYSSDESGRQEIYVTRFPEGGRKWQVSTEGGSFPEWNGAADELFYLDENNVLNAVSVTAEGDRIIAGKVEPLFQTRARYGWTDPLAVRPDGQRFLINTVEMPAAPSPVTLVVGWPAELEKKRN